jgi:hypothetical protein
VSSAKNHPAYFRPCLIKNKDYFLNWCRNTQLNKKMLAKISHTPLLQPP